MRAILLVGLFLCTLLTAQCVQVVEVQVTATFLDCFYVEEYDRSSGIAARYTGTTPALGDLLYMSGYVSSLPSGERIFMAESIQVDGEIMEDARVRPLQLPNRAIGGGSASLYTPGVVGGTGLNNIGLLVTTSGRVTRIESGRFFITDGHAVEIGVVVEGGLTAPELNSYVLVTGIATMDEAHAPMVRPRSSADVLDLGICSLPNGYYSSGQSMGSLSYTEQLPVRSFSLPPFYGQYSPR